jgi:hypothetical protein
MERRAATFEEIFRHFKHYRQVSYRHFVREVRHRRAEYGVAQREIGRSRLYDIVGVPHVRYQGKLWEVTADFITLENGGVVVDLRLNSEYLK